MTALWRVLVTSSLWRSAPSRPSQQSPNFKVNSKLLSSYRLLPTSRFCTNLHWLDTPTPPEVSSLSALSLSDEQIGIPALSHSVRRFSQPLNRTSVRNSLWIYSVPLALAGSGSSKSYPGPIDNRFQLSCLYIVSVSSWISFWNCW
jgi:hypothetical protein